MAGRSVRGELGKETGQGTGGDDLAYERGALKRFGGLGFTVEVYEFPEDIEQRRLESEFQDINDNPSVHGILLFRPLPKHLDGEALRRAIDPRKDVDGNCKVGHSPH